MVAYFNQWAAYKACISTILQKTKAFADIAVLHPLADMWTLHDPQRPPFPRLLYPSHQYKIWEAIHKNGNCCVYTSEGIIQKSITGNGYSKYGHRKYNTLISIEGETRDIDQLFNLSGDESTRSFAGCLYYEKDFNDNAGYQWLDFGKACGVSKVSVDNEILGNKWDGRHLYALPNNAGGKTLQIKIKTTVVIF